MLPGLRRRGSSEGEERVPVRPGSTAGRTPSEANELRQSEREPLCCHALLPWWLDAPKPGRRVTWVADTATDVSLAEGGILVGHWVDSARDRLPVCLLATYCTCCQRGLSSPLHAGCHILLGCALSMAERAEACRTPVHAGSRTDICALKHTYAVSCWWT